MNEAGEGVIKFQCRWYKGAPPPAQLVDPLHAVRAELFAQKLIGATADGISYGNLSVRVKNTEEFIIFASDTGKLPQTSACHYARVRAYSITENTITCEGQLQASSESLTHAALYEASATVGSVIHVHHAGMWRHYYNSAARTPAGIAYGTPAMARAVQEVFRALNCAEDLIVMGGHTDGILSYAANPGRALAVLTAYLQAYRKEPNRPASTTRLTGKSAGNAL